MSTDVFTLHSSDPTFHYIRISNCFFNMQILSSTNHTNTETAERAACFYMCNAEKIFLEESAASIVSMVDWIPKLAWTQQMWHSISLHLCLTVCLLFTRFFRSTKPQDPVLPILPLFTWQLPLFHMVITTLKFTWHFSFLPASLNSYTNDVNTYRTIAYHELISTKCTGACVHRAIPKKRLAYIKKKIKSIILTEAREPEFIGLFFCVVGPGCWWDQWLEMM